MSLNSRLEGNPELGEVLLPLLMARDFDKPAKLIECLDDGFVKLVDSMGNDAAVVQAARVSYGEGTKHISDDRGLIRYLMRHTHTTPFEMVEFKFLVRVPMDCWRQWIRHRMASVNEYSTRYSEAIDSAQRATEWRAQATGNKQGSSGLVDSWPEGYEVTPGEQTDAGQIWDKVAFTRDGCDYNKIILSTDPQKYLAYEEKKLLKHARDVYNERLEFGVAREQARKDLPLSTYTEAYWKIDLHNLFHFLRLRIDSHAQAEIREYGAAILNLIEPIVPLCVEAFQDYRVKAMSLSGPELKVLEILNMRYAVSDWPLSGRENAEFRAKLPRLGLHHYVKDFDDMLANLGIK